MNSMCYRLLIMLAVFSFCSALLRYESPAVVSVIASDGGNYTLSGPPYDVKTHKDHPSTLTIALQYFPGQNTSVAMETLGGCISHIAIRNLPEKPLPSVPMALNIVRFCHEGVLDLFPYIKEGVNAITLEVDPDPSGIYWDTPDIAHIIVVPVLLGTQLFSTLACSGIFMLLAAASYMLLRRFEIDGVVSGIAITGMAYYALWLHIRPNALYTADMPDHFRYVLFMIRHWWQPYEYHGGENHQPPLYYMLAGLCIDWLGAAYVSPLAIARIFSLFLYMVFVAFGLRTIQEAMPQQPALRNLGALLFVFWPVAVDMASNINNDLAIYACWAPAFYYLTRWYRRDEIPSLWLCILYVAVAMLIKSTAFVLVGIVAAVMLCGLFTGRLTYGHLVQKKGLFAYGALVLGVAGGVGKLIYTKAVYGQSIAIANISYLYFAGVSDHALYPWYYYLHFDLWDFIANPYSLFLHEPGFLNYFLKTMLYSQWNHPDNIWGLANAINLQLGLFLLFAVAGTAYLFARSKSLSEDLLPMVLCVLFSMAGVILFTVMHNDEFCQSLRYVYPILIPLIILYVRGLEAIRMAKGGQLFYWAGMVLGVSFPFSALIFYLHFQPLA